MSLTEEAIMHTTIPIVVTSAGDLVGRGLVASLALS